MCSSDLDGYASLFCLQQALEAGCQDLGTAYDTCIGQFPPDPRCDAYCQALDTCGLPGAGATCVADCGVLAATDVDAMGRLRATLSCVDANTCDALATCLDDRSAETVCGRACDTLGACQADLDGEVCRADCLATYGRVQIGRAHV